MPKGSKRVTADPNLLEKLVRLPEPKRSKLLSKILSLSPKAKRLLLKSPDVTLRPRQRPPMTLPWSTCFFGAGRGWGKTHGGAHWVVGEAKVKPRGAIVGPTLQDVRQTMVEEGILRVAPANFTPIYKPNLKKLIWPNGHETFIYSADRPDRLRGPNISYAWADEVAAWRFLKKAWSMMKFCLRKSADPRTLATTTPRSTEEYREIRKAPGTHIVPGTTFENLANLSAKWFREEILPLLHTALGRQEILAELIDDIVGALLSREVLDKFRVRLDWDSGNPNWTLYQRIRAQLKLKRVVVAVDPQAAKKPGNETGIVCAARGHDGCGYMLEDASINGLPKEWAKAAMVCYGRNQASAIIVERNHGGDMVKDTIYNYCRANKLARPKIIEVVASKGKQARAEPFTPYFEVGQIRHVGQLHRLEDQWCGWVPGESPESPNRLDAAVWALAHLFPRTLRDVLPIARIS